MNEEPQPAPDPQSAPAVPAEPALQYQPVPPYEPVAAHQPVPPYGPTITQPVPQPLGAAARASVPSWLWPAIAALALVVGLVGGALGGALIQRVDLGSGLQVGNTRTEPPLSADNESVAAVAEELLPSTVQVLAGIDAADGGATGSGFVLDNKGHVVTNNHVVASAAESGSIAVVDYRGNRHEAQVVGRSQVYDLAVLKIRKDSGLRVASLGASEALRVGDVVVAFGAPLGLSQTVTAGIVSALNRPVTTGSSSDDTSFINAVQTDAAINPGNSGGPLVNLSGQVVGVNSAIATTGGLQQDAGSIGVGFAIPIEQVITTADQILRTGEARYPVIGAKVRTGGSTELDGAVIDQVMEGAPAAAAGLRKGDLVVAVNGDRITDGIALIVAIRTHRPGESIELTVVRDDEERTVELTLDSEVG